MTYQHSRELPELFPRTDTIHRAELPRASHRRHQRGSSQPAAQTARRPHPPASKGMRTVPLTARSTVSSSRNATQSTSKTGSIQRRVLNAREAAAERAQKRMRNAQSRARLKQDEEDQILHRRMLESFAQRTDNTLQARLQLQHIAELLGEASSPSSKGLFGEIEEEEDETAMMVSPSGNAERDHYLNLIAEARKKGAKLPSHPHASAPSSSGPSEGAGAIGGLPVKQLPVVYEHADSHHGMMDEDEDPNAFTDPRNMFLRQRTQERVHSVDDIDPVKTKNRYAAALLFEPPHFTSTSLGVIMETAVADSVEVRLATENVLRVVTDPQQKLWKAGSLEGELARLQFHCERMSNWIKAGVEHVPLYREGSDTIQIGAKEEVDLFRRSVIQDKELVDVLERHCERQYNANETLRRNIAELNEELVSKRFLLEGYRGLVPRALGREIFDKPIVMTAIPSTPMMIFDVADALITSAEPVPTIGVEGTSELGAGQSIVDSERRESIMASSGALQQPPTRTPSFVSADTSGAGSPTAPIVPFDDRQQQESAIQLANSSVLMSSEESASSSMLLNTSGLVKTDSILSVLARDTAGALSAHGIDEEVIWVWTMERLRNLVAQRRTKLDAVLSVGGVEGLHTTLLGTAEMSDSRPREQIEAEIRPLEALADGISPAHIPPLRQLPLKIVKQLHTVSGLISQIGLPPATPTGY